MNTVVREAAVVVGLATLIALVYNAFNPQGIPLIRQERHLPGVADSVLLQELGQSLQQTAQQPGGLSASGDTTASAPKQAAPSTDRSEPRAQRAVPEAAEKPQAAVPEEAPIRAVRYEQVLRLLEHPEVLLIDARRPEDYAAGHIPGARNIFAYDFAAHIPELITLPRTKPILIYCDGGRCELSHYLAEQLRNLGFQRLYIYEGGWEEWRRRHSQ